MRLDPWQARLPVACQLYGGGCGCGEGGKISAPPSHFFRDPKTVLKIKTTIRYSEKVLHFCEYKMFLLVLFACHSPPGAKGGRMAVLGVKRCVETLA